MSSAWRVLLDQRFFGFDVKRIAIRTIDLSKGKLI